MIRKQRTGFRALRQAGQEWISGFLGSLKPRTAKPHLGLLSFSRLPSPEENRSHTPPGSAAHHSLNRSPHLRPLRVESLEDRQLLSIGGVDAEEQLRLVGQPAASTSSIAELMSSDSGEIHGTKWSDLDGDGTRDAGEPGLAGVTIYLDLNCNGRLDEGEPRTLTIADDPATTADEAGTYSFSVAPGTYVVAEVTPEGWRKTYPVASPSVASGGATWFDLLPTGEGVTDTELVTDAGTIWTRTWLEPLRDSRGLTEALANRELMPLDNRYSHLTLNQDPEGDMPREVTFTRDGAHVLVVNRDTDNVIVHDADTMEVVANIRVGDFPVHITATPDGRYALVANRLGNSLSVIDVSDWSIAATVPLGELPFRTAVTSDSQYAVVAIDGGSGSSSFAVVSLDTFEVVRTIATPPQGTVVVSWTSERVMFGYSTFALAPDDRTLFLPDTSGDQLMLYDLQTGETLAAIPVAGGVASVTLNP
jgi:YVTN family beta-propeller protein